MLVRESVLLGTGILRHCLRTFADGMLRQLTGKEKSNRGLNFARRNGFPLVVVSKPRCFAGDSLEDVIDERVHDAHRSAGNSNVGMNLLQNSVDVSTITLLVTPSPLRHLRSFLSASDTFLRALLRRTLSGRRLTTGTHLPKFDTVK